MLWLPYILQTGVRRRPRSIPHSIASDHAYLAAGLRQRGQVLAVLPNAQLASEAGTFRPDKQGKAFTARMSDELEPLHRVRWSWQAQGPPASSVDGKRACGSKLLSQQVQRYPMQTPLCEAMCSPTMSLAPHVGGSAARMVCLLCSIVHVATQHRFRPSLHERRSWSTA